MERKITFRDLLAILPCDVMVGVIDRGNGRSVSASMFVDDWDDINRQYQYPGDRFVVLISDVKADQINVILEKVGDQDEDAETAR